MRTSEGSNDGIKCNGYDIDIDLVFEERPWMLLFQTHLLKIVGNTTSNKKPGIAVESKVTGDDYEEEVYRGRRK